MAPARAVSSGAAALLFSLTSHRKRALLPLPTFPRYKLGDVAIGATQGIPGVMVGASALALIHLATAGRLMLRRSRAATAAT
ncbi:hypothetical protein ACW2Q0_06365 [Nocardia sp. R16R-3T]